MIRVLIVEDDPDDAILTRSYLDESRRVKFESDLATNPEVALAMMALGEHDICLLDYMLGATDGLSLYAEAQARGYTNPVILLTGLATVDVAGIALAAGVSDFIEKQRVDGLLLERMILYSLERKRVEMEILTLNASLEGRVGERTAQLVGANEELVRRATELETARQGVDQAILAKNWFVDSVTHDLRTPLNGIIGLAEFLVDGNAGHLDPLQHEYLTDILNNGRHLLRLINDVLDVAKAETVKRTAPLRGPRLHSDQSSTGE